MENTLTSLLPNEAETAKDNTNMLNAKRTRLNLSIPTKYFAIVINERKNLNPKEDKRSVPEEFSNLITSTVGYVKVAVFVLEKLEGPVLGVAEILNYESSCLSLEWLITNQNGIHPKVKFVFSQGNGIKTAEILNGSETMKKLFDSQNKKVKIDDSKKLPGTSPTTGTFEDKAQIQKNSHMDIKKLSSILSSDADFFAIVVKEEERRHLKFENVEWFIPKRHDIILTRSTKNKQVAVFVSGKTTGPVIGIADISGYKSPHISIEWLMINLEGTCNQLKFTLLPDGMPLAKISNGKEKIQQLLDKIKMDKNNDNSKKGNPSNKKYFKNGKESPVDRTVSHRLPKELSLEIIFKHEMSCEARCPFIYLQFFCDNETLEKVSSHSRLDKFGFVPSDMKHDKRYLILVTSKTNNTIFGLAEIDKVKSENNSFQLTWICKETAEIKKKELIGQCHENCIQELKSGKDLIKIYFRELEKMPARLEHLGNSCYLNSILQCLRACHSREEIGEILAKLDSMPQKDLDSTNKTLAYDFFEKIDMMYNTDDVICDASDVKRHVSLCSAKFGTYEQQDAFEFLICLISNLEKELMTYGLNIIKELFACEILTDIAPLCGHVDTARQTEYAVVLRPKLNCHKETSLEDCWEEMFTSEPISELFCPTCPDGKNIGEGHLRVSLSNLPKNLIIYISRFNNRRPSKIDTKVTFKLDGFKITNPRSDSAVYKAVAFCEHYGTLKTGHYVAHVRGQSGDIWFNCNDIKDVQEIEKFKDRVSSSSVYLIFYKNTTVTGQ